MSLIKILEQFCDKLLSPDVPLDKKYRTLKAIREMEVSEEHIRVTKLGKVVKKCTKLGGKLATLADEIIKEWKEMIYRNNNNILLKKTSNVTELPKMTKYQETKINNCKKYEKTSSGSQSESSEENENVNKKHQDKSNIIQNHSKIYKVNNKNSSDEENYKTIKNNYKKTISNSEDESEIPVKQLIDNKPSKKQEIHKTNRNSGIIKSNKIINSDNNDDDSSDCDEFIEILSKNQKNSHKNSYDKPIKYSSDEESYSDNEYETIKCKIPNKQPVKETKYKSDESSDSDEAYINYLETVNDQIKNNKTSHSKPTNAPLGFLEPINDQKSQKKVIDNVVAKKEINNQMKKPIETKTLISNNNIKTELNKQHKPRKSEIKSAPSFEDFLKGSAINKPPTDTNPRKRKSELPQSQIDNKKKISTLSTTFIPADLSNCPALNSSSLSNSDMDEQSVYNRTDIIFQQTKKDNHINEKVKEDVDCTTKYSSERKIWTPKSGIKPEFVEENLRTINGVLETEIAQYSYEKLSAFDADSRKIQRKTETFWEKLFKKNHKSANRRDGETWRDAYLRNQRDQDIRLKQISERLKKTTEQNANAVTKAKLLTNSSNFAKPKRRMTDMRR